MKLPVAIALFGASFLSPTAFAAPVLLADDYDLGPAELHAVSELPATLPGQGNILFINLNLNPKERMAVQRYADATHQNVVSFPDDQLMADLSPVYSKYAKSSDRVFQLGTEISLIQANIEAPKYKRAKALQKRWALEVQALYDEMNFESNDYQSSLKETAHAVALAHYGQTAAGVDHEMRAWNAYRNALTQLVAKAIADQTQFQTVVISGHHGQYFFGDLTLSFDESVEASDPRYFSLTGQLKPLLQAAKSIALWGCDTISADSAAQWLALAPEYQTLIGYSDTAPKGSRESSSSFLEKGLLAGPNLIMATNPTDLRKQVDAIPGVENSAAAVVVRSPSLGAIMISTSIGDNHGEVVLNRTAEDLSESFQCAGLKAQMDDTLSAIQPYFSGARELPADDVLSPVKRAYFFLHHNEKCFKSSPRSFASVYQVGLLRFFDTDVKFNIASALADQIRDSRAELANTQYTALKNIDFQTLLTQKTRPAIIAALETASGSALRLNVPATLTLLKSLSRLVFNLDDTCMPFDLWHERSTLPLKLSCDLSR